MKKIYLVLIAGCLSTMSMANNIQLGNVTLNGQNTVSMFSLVNFDVSWENSWRTITNETNYDGAWLFVKFRKKTSTLWQHATLNTTGSTIPAGSVLQTSLDGKGAWIYKALPGADFTGNVNYTGAKLQWNYGVDGVLNTDSVEIRVFALEMVYVPAGAYKLGTGGAETNHFFEGGSNIPYSVASSGAITVSNTSPNLFYSGGGDAAGPIPAAFPKGFAAFWMMKYESSQQQYVDFLNNLDLTRATNRNPLIFTGTHPNLVAPFPERAMNGLSIPDQAAFSDWAALRPFTELEYEKACRGANIVPLPNEYVWGSTSITPTTAVTNAGLDVETANNGNANYANNYSAMTRCGIYATAASTRQTSGGSFYGIMDLGGNVAETCVGVGAPTSRTYTGVNGDGLLDAAGDANTSFWPTVAAAYALRGGYISAAAAELRTSDRNNGSFSLLSRQVYIGVRVSRTAE